MKCIEKQNRNNDKQTWLIELRAGTKRARAWNNKNRKYKWTASYSRTKSAQRKSLCNCATSCHCRLFRPFNYILCIIIFVLGTSHLWVCRILGFFFMFRVIWPLPINLFPLLNWNFFSTHFHPSNEQVANDFKCWRTMVKPNHKCYFDLFTANSTFTR